MSCAQDPETAAISFMPGQAVSLGVVNRILKPEQMAEFISSLQ